MKLLVTGANGQLGRCLQDRLEGRNIHYTAYGSADLDIADATAVERVLRRDAPDAVINAAAYTAVDKAESEPERAHRVNSQGAENLAKACSAIGAVLLHVSTDYVFDGLSKTPYCEADPVGPLGVYGASKLHGEQRVAEVLERHLIVRTAWVFSEYGSNFFKTMLRLADQRQSLKVVSDQVGCPTYAGDLASALITMAEHAIQREFSGWGIYHYGGDSPVSWCDFARFIVAQGTGLGVLKNAVNVAAIPSCEYPTPAPRPSYSVLDCRKIARFGVAASDWQAATTRLITQIGN